MATKHNYSGLTQETPVCKFHKKITDEKDLHTQELGKFKINIEAWEAVRAYAMCSLAKSEQTFEYYRDLTNYELFDMKDSAEIIKANIDENVKQDVELGKLILDVSKSLNDLQVKLHNANNTACAMRNCLQSILSFKDDKMPDKLKPLIDNVIDKAKNLSKDGKQAAEAMVKVAGIHTFSNLETLQPFAIRLTQKLTDLKTLTDGLIATAKKEQEIYQAELFGVLKELNKVEFESFRSTVKINAEDNTLDFICGEECEPEPIKCVEQICKNLGNKEPEAGYSTKSHLQDDGD